MRALFAISLVFSMVFAGCGSCGEAPKNPSEETDSGVVFDAGADAGSGKSDAGTPDAGDADAGPPPELKILRVLPPRGSSAGGTSVLLTGSAFIREFATRGTLARQQTSLKLGSNVVQDIQIIDDETMEIRTPPGALGLTNVTLENPNGKFVCTGCFTYFEDVFLSSVVVAQAPLSGGNEVTLTGGGMTPDMKVLFGGVSSPKVTWVSTSQLKVVTPPRAVAENVDVVIYNKNGVGTLLRAFQYVADTRLTNVAPMTGPVAGGTTVILTGTGLSGATAVKFGNIDASSFVVNSATQVTAVAPAAAVAAAVDVSVVTPRETWTAKKAFSYVSNVGTLTALSVFPHVVSASGGDRVTLTGTGLSSMSVTVQVGNSLAAISSRSLNELSFSVPSRGGAPRKVDVTVTDGVQTVTLSQALTYRMGVSSVNVSEGTSLGGTAMTVTGAQFPSDAEVRVGALSGTITGTPTETQLSALTPAGSTGATVKVRVREAADPENEAEWSGAFTYLAPIAIGRVQPARGAIAGGTLVTVLGAGFAEGTLVDFGTQRAKDIKVIDLHTLSCRIPKGEVGTVDVKVSREARTDVLPGGFSYFDPRSGSGGLSGGPLVGTLNVTVLEATQGAYGTPVPAASVMLGVDSSTPFQGLTDRRGQLTFSDPSLVKAQTVTVFKSGFQSTTVTAVNSENLTVLVERVGGGGPPAPPPPSVPASLVSGRVTGFKPPRLLASNESLEARVFLAQTSFYQGPPFRAPSNRQGEKWQVVKDGGEYLLFTAAGLKAAYAILGVKNSQTGEFRPYLMGVKRGITTSADSPATGQDIVLDMHLDVTVPITIDNPINVVSMGMSRPAVNQVYAWLDLGAEGLIPNPLNWNSGTQASTSISGTQSQFQFAFFPRLDGSNFIFLNLANGASAYPQSLYYRRQPGDLSAGVTIGPMLSAPNLLEPAGSFNGTIRWATDPGPTADLVEVQVLKPTLAGPVNLWSVILPGTETQVSLPAAALQQLSDDQSGEVVFIAVILSRSPKFNYAQWTYDSLSGVNWSSYAVTIGSGVVVP